MKFTAEMQHTNESIHQLSKVQHHAFRPGVRLLWSGCGVASIWGAVNAGDQFLFYLLMFAGIWLLLNLELPAKHQADKIIKAANGSLPHTRYRFEDEEIQIFSGDYKKHIAYNQLYALLEDKSYYYLFINRNAGFVVDRKRISPDAQEEWKAFLQEKSGLRFRRAASMWTGMPLLPGKSRKNSNRL